MVSGGGCGVGGRDGGGDGDGDGNGNGGWEWWVGMVGGGNPSWYRGDLRHFLNFKF